MPQIKLPTISSNELPPRVRLAHKFQAAVAANKNTNERKGELYEVAVGIRLQQFGWLTGGYQVGRSSLHQGESDQKVYVGNSEVDGLLRRGLDRRWLITQMKSSSGEGGSQIREAVEFVLLDQVQAAKEGRGLQLAGLVYAEPTRSLDQAQRKIVENVAKLIRERDFSAATNCTRDDFAQVLELNSRKLGIPVKEAEKRLSDIARQYKDFPIAEYRRQVFADVEALLGVSLIPLNPELLPEKHLEVLLEPELHRLEESSGKASSDGSRSRAATANSQEN
jgi:hypothetical protein